MFSFIQYLAFISPFYYLVSFKDRAKERHLESDLGYDYNLCCQNSSLYSDLSVSLVRRRHLIAFPLYLP